MYEEYRNKRLHMRPRGQSWNPDRRWSDNDYWFIDRGNETILMMEIKGHGVLRMRATGGHDDGKLRFEGVALITKDEIYFD